MKKKYLNYVPAPLNTLTEDDLRKVYKLHCACIIDDMDDLDAVSSLTGLTIEVCRGVRKNYSALVSKFPHVMKEFKFADESLAKDFKSFLP